jgi:Tfp pilus assembly protein PilN
LPDEVRITSVKPHSDRTHGTVLLITVVARGVDDVLLFMGNLEATEAFTNLRPAEERVNEHGELESVLEMAYAPTPAKPPAAKEARP